MKKKILLFFLFAIFLYPVLMLIVPRKVYAQTCTASFQNSVQENSPTRIEIELPPGGYLNPVVCPGDQGEDQEEGCFQIRACRTGGAGYGGCAQGYNFRLGDNWNNMGPWGTQSIDPGPPRKIIAEIPHMTASLTFWLETGRRSTNRGRTCIGEHTIHVVPIPASCADGTFNVVKKGTNEGTTDGTILLYSDNLELLFDGNRTSNFGSGEYALVVKRSNGTEVASLTVVAHSGQLRRPGDPIRRLWMGQLPYGDYSVVIRDLIGTEIYCVPWPFGVDDGSGNFPSNPPGAREDFRSFYGETGSKITVPPTVQASICKFTGVNSGKCRACFNKDDPSLWTPFGCVSFMPDAFVADVMRIAIGVAGGIAFLLILFGGFQILTSTGNPEKLNAGKELVGSAITGLLLILFSVFILRIIGVNILGIPGFE